VHGGGATGKATGRASLDVTRLQHSPTGQSCSSGSERRQAAPERASLTTGGSFMRLTAFKRGRSTASARVNSSAVRRAEDGSRAITYNYCFSCTFTLDYP
jgi:hypothetical protein